MKEPTIKTLTSILPVADNGPYILSAGMWSRARILILFLVRAMSIEHARMYYLPVGLRSVLDRIASYKVSS